MLNGTAAATENAGLEYNGEVGSDMTADWGILRPFSKRSYMARWSAEDSEVGGYLYCNRGRLSQTRE